VTPEERAHGIVGSLWPDDPQPKDIAETERYLAEQIRVAEREAYEEAARIVRGACKERSCENRCYHEHAIRARAGEGK